MANFAGRYQSSEEYRIIHERAQTGASRLQVAFGSNRGLAAIMREPRYCCPSRSLDRSAYVMIRALNRFPEADKQYDGIMNRNSAEHALVRATEFASSVGAQTAVFLAPMAGACPPSLSIAVANAGGMGACGALLMSPQAITSWADEFRKQSEGPFQMNLWVPDPPPVRNEEAEARQREFLAGWGPMVPADAGNEVLPDFEAQCRAMIEARPTAISSIMGLYPPSFVAEMKAQGIRWFATATTLAEARAAEAAGADAIVTQDSDSLRDTAKSLCLYAPRSLPK